ncbi:MAG: hypothetical protein P1P64_04755 [Treponemataceae bacterium]
MKKSYGIYLMFKCSACGECCRHLDKSKVYKSLDRGDGVCKYLSGNMCTIYKDRPLLCRVDESFEAYFKDRMSKEDYYNLNYESCKRLKENAREKSRGLD